MFYNAVQMTGISATPNAFPAYLPIDIVPMQLRPAYLSNQAVQALVDVACRRRQWPAALVAETS
jgi:hypothetical protein